MVPYVPRALIFPSPQPVVSRMANRPFPPKGPSRAVKQPLQRFDFLRLDGLRRVAPARGTFPNEVDDGSHGLHDKGVL